MTKPAAAAVVSTIRDLFREGMRLSVYTASGEFQGTVRTVLDDGIVLGDAGLQGRTSPDAFDEVCMPFAGMTAVRWLS